MLLILVAGHDITAYSLAWTLKKLAKKPEDQSNLRARLLVTPKEERNDLEASYNVIKMRITPSSSCSNGWNSYLHTRYCCRTLLGIPKMGSHLLFTREVESI